jgi:hypothetical protein
MWVAAAQHPTHSLNTTKSSGNACTAFDAIVFLFYFATSGFFGPAASSACCTITSLLLMDKQKGPNRHGKHENSC